MECSFSWVRALINKDEKKENDRGLSYVDVEKYVDINNR